MMKGDRGEEIGDVVPVPGLPKAESQIAVPLLTRAELMGVFSIESPVRYTFGEHDRGTRLDCRQPKSRARSTARASTWTGLTAARRV